MNITVWQESLMERKPFGVATYYAIYKLCTPYLVTLNFCGLHYIDNAFLYYNELLHYHTLLIHQSECL